MVEHLDTVLLPSPKPQHCWTLRASAQCPELLPACRGREATRGARRSPKSPKQGQGWQRHLPETPSCACCPQARPGAT